MKKISIHKYFLILCVLKRYQDIHKIKNCKTSIRLGSVLREKLNSPRMNTVVPILYDPSRQRSPLLSGQISDALR
jgi:hypothetical protein